MAAPALACLTCAAARLPILVTSGGGLAITLGSKSGEETHTLSAAEMAAHSHAAAGSNAQANDNAPTGHVLAQSGQIYGPASSLTQMRAGSIGVAGGGQAHDNMQPYLALNFVIALQGLFPSRN